MFRKTLIALIVLFAALPLAAEYLFLKDGSIIKGQVVAERPADVTFRTDEDKQTKRYPRSQVMRVLYTEIKMGRVYVQLRTGEVHRVYMVDEDRTTYTFRKELYEPDEFKITREDVLFMAERNPTALKGAEPGLDRIELEWLPSFEKMRHYNVYLKKKGDDYAEPKRSSGEKYNLRGLESNTEYTVKVTGFAGAGDETTSSNEFTFLTANRPPNPPSDITIEEDDRGRTKLTWQPAEDPDGRVVEYRVYAIKGKERVLAGQSNHAGFTLKAGTEYDRLDVTAVDDRGAESGEDVLRRAVDFDYSYSLALIGGIIYPMGNFGELVEMGYGGSLNLTKHNLFMPGFELGFSTGFYYMPGKDDIVGDIPTTDRAFFAPLLINAGYRFIVTESIHIMPNISAGAAYLDMRYEEVVEGELKDKHLKGIGPMAAAGVSLDFNISESFYIGLNAEYGLLITGTLFDYSFMRIEAAAGYRFF